jgi:hypothetical protein
MSFGQASLGAFIVIGISIIVAGILALFSVYIFSPLQAPVSTDSIFIFVTE